MSASSVARTYLSMTLAGAVLFTAAESYAQSTPLWETLQKTPEVLRDTGPNKYGDFSVRTPSQRSLGRCWPADDCSTPDKPCYLELTQDDFSEVLIGSDESAPLVGAAAFRVRLCTSNTDPLDNSVCEDTSDDQELDYMFFNLKEESMADQVVLWSTLDAATDTIDSGPYSEVGTHNFFGVVCQAGDQPCRIAWQYCELPQPDPSETLTSK